MAEPTDIDTGPRGPECKRLRGEFEVFSRRLFDPRIPVEEVNKQGFENGLKLLREHAVQCDNCTRYLMKVAKAFEEAKGDPGVL